MFDSNEKMTMNEIQRRFPRVYKDNVMLDNLSKLSIQYSYYKTMIQAFMGQYHPQDYQAEYQAYVKDFDEYEYGEIKLGNQLAAFSIVWDGVDSEQFQKLEYSSVHQIATAKICSFREGWDMYYTAANVICLASAQKYVNIDATQGLTRGIGSYLEAAGVESLEVSEVSHCSPGWKNFWGQNGRLDVGQVITADDECYFVSNYTPPDGMMLRLECNSQNAAGTSGYYWYVRSSDKLALPWVYRYCNGDWFNKNGISSYPFEVTTRLEVGKVYDVGRRVSAFSTGSLFAPLFRSATAAQVMTYEQFVAEKQRQAKYELYVMTYQPLPVTRKVEKGDVVQDLHIVTDGVHVADTGAIDFSRVCDFVSGESLDKSDDGEYPGRSTAFAIGTQTIAATGEAVGIEGEYVVSVVYPNSAYWHNTYILDGVEWRNIAIGDTIKGTTKMKYEAMQYSRLVLDFTDEYVANEFLYGNKTGTLAMLYVVHGDGTTQDVEIKDGATVSLPIAREVVEINAYNPIYGLLRVDTVTKPLPYDAWVSTQG